MKPTPLSCRWLEADSRLVQLRAGDRERRIALVRRAFADIGVEENLTNRSPYIDEVVKEAGSPEASSWCACIVRRWCKDAGMQFPAREAGAVRAWVAWAKGNGTWRDAAGYTPLPGDIVCYDMSKDDGIADHIAIVARQHGKGPRTIEGNTSWSGFSREGTACDFKPIAANRVLGYIVPQAATP